MDPVLPLEATRLFLGDLSLGYLIEIIVRVLFIYLFALIFLRAGGKRARKQLTPVEMLLVVALGSAVGDVMFYQGVPLIYPALIIITVIVTQHSINMLKQKYNKVEKFLNSAPRLIIKNGVYQSDAMTDEGLTNDVVESMLRVNGVRNLNELEYVYLELSGDISIFKTDQPIKGVDKQLLPPKKTSPFLAS